MCERKYLYSVLLIDDKKTKTEIKNLRTIIVMILPNLHAV